MTLCDAQEEPQPSGEVGNKHTAKFRIFADKARRLTTEVCAPSLCAITHMQWCGWQAVPALVALVYA